MVLLLLCVLLLLYVGFIIICELMVLSLLLLLLYVDFIVIICGF